MPGETVLLHRRTQTGTDRYGKPLYGWEPPEVITSCGVAPRSSEEPAQVGRQAVITGLSVYLPRGTVLGPYDRLTVRGEVYEVEGEAGEWVSPYTGKAAGVEVAVARVEG